MGNLGSLADDIYYDPYDFAIDADPHPVWKRMRDERPLYHNERFNFYAVSRYEDVRRMSLDWQTFSSARGSILELIDAPPEVIEAVRNILFEDPPMHDLHRMILARAFSPKRIADLEVKIRALCAEYLDPFVGGGEFDYVAEFGRKIPMMVIGMLLGVPEEDREHLQELANGGVQIEEEGPPMDHAEQQRKVGEYFSSLVALRRKDPQEDLTTVLVEAEFDDDKGTHRRLDDGELLRYLSLVSGAGNETVANLMGWAGITLHRHPAERRKLVDDPDVDPQRRRGAAALRGPVAGVVPVRHPRRGGPRPDRAGRLQDGAAGGIGQPR